MSGSALSSAKRRRANNVTNSPLFQTPGSKESEITNESMTTPSPQSNRPMTLQQALQVLNGRILQLEKNLESSKNDTSNTASSTSLDVSSIEDIVKKVTETQIFEEFNHRYEVLASEILNLKHIVMKLQSYTLDINKTLVEERIQILSDIPEKQGVSLIEIKDDLNLRRDIEEMVQNSELDSKQAEEIEKTLESIEIKEKLLDQMEENEESISISKETPEENENVTLELQSNEDDNESINENIKSSIENTEESKEEEEEEEEEEV